MGPFGFGFARAMMVELWRVHPLWRFAVIVLVLIPLAAAGAEVAVARVLRFIGCPGGV